MWRAQFRITQLLQCCSLSRRLAIAFELEPRHIDSSPQQRRHNTETFPMEAMKFCTLNNGLRMPLLGLGTFKLMANGECANSVQAALTSGLRMIDTAAIYKNEADVSEGISKCTIPRSEIFVTSKLKPHDHGRAYDACIESLRELKMACLDLYLVHWPGVAKLKQDDPCQAAIRKETWIQMQRLYHEGKVKAIGVSNYLPRHIDEFFVADDDTVPDASVANPGLGGDAKTLSSKRRLQPWVTVPPVVNQFELHPLLQQRSVVAACERAGIQVQSYSTLARGAPELLQHHVITSIAARHGKTPAQVVLRWAIQHGWAVIPKSTSAERIRENAACLEGPDLSADEMAAIDGLECGHRTCWDPSNIR